MLKDTMLKKGLSTHIFVYIDSERLFAIHASDNNGREDSHSIPFAGTIGWAQVAAVLKKIGFDGYFMFEIRNRDNIDDTLNRINESFKRISEGKEE
ncbi:MAG: hypothetical protein HZA06_02050 [Nitrospirae bacterium]|nr:hypothetical protein [Nitrospirota bacterium]